MSFLSLTVWWSDFRHGIPERGVRIRPEIGAPVRLLLPRVLPPQRHRRLPLRRPLLLGLLHRDLRHGRLASVDRFLDGQEHFGKNHGKT